MEKTCKHCKKKVTSPVGCEVCNSYYHPSCAAQAKVMNKENKMVCCKTHGKSEVRGDESRELLNNFIEEDKLKTIVKVIFKETFSPFQNKLQEDMQELKNSVQYMSDSFEDQKSTTEKLLAEMKLLRDENRALKQRLKALEEKSNILEQKERQNNMIVTGIPSQENENTRQVIHQVLQTMELNIPQNKIIDCYRIKQKKDGPIFVRLPEPNIKANIYGKIKKLKGIKVNECGLQGKNGNIFFNEDLTATNQLLFRSTRIFKKENNFKAAFCINGKIYLKKTSDDKAVLIRSEQELTVL